MFFSQGNELFVGFPPADQAYAESQKFQII
jgi:hypothetical protein